MTAFALISDLHGNAIALRGVLRSIRARGADRIVCLGDVATLGVAPAEVVDVLREIGCPCIMGNHDEYLLDPELTNSKAPLSQISHRVVLEITERAALSEVKDVRNRVAALREMGFRIAIDDLGAGYAGLTSFATLEPEIAGLRS